MYSRISSSAASLGKFFVGRGRHVLSTCAVVSMGLGSAQLAGAQTRDDSTRSAARTVALAGVAALQHGDAETASAKLEKAYQVLQVPSVGLWSARALAKRGLLVEASERYQEIARLGVQQGEKAVQLQARQDAVTELEQLAARIPSIAIALEGARPEEVTLTVDGMAVPAALILETRPLNPGKHRVLGQVADQSSDQTVTLAESARLTVTLHFTPKPVVKAQPPAKTEPPAPLVEITAGGGAPKIVPYVALGVGGAVMAAGAVFGVLAIQKKNALESNSDCIGGQCLRGSEEKAVQSLNTMRTLSTVSLVTGGALAAAGVVLVFTSRPSNAQQAEHGRTVTLAFGPGSATMTGEF